MKIYYLRGPSGGLDQFIKYKDTIEKFINRGSGARGLNFEKLKVSEKAAIYSIRVNDVGRILLMKYKDGYCLVGVVEDHKYEQSQVFKNPLVFSRLLSAASGEAVELPTHEDFIAAEAAAGASSAGGKRRFCWVNADDEVADDKPAAPGSLDFSPLEYHGQFITLNPEQEAVAIHPSLPVIVSGPAGSGKSSVALSMLLNYLRENRDKPEAFPILYVCESQKLVEEMRTLWQAMLGTDAEALSLVEFKRYDEMVAEQLHVDAAMLLGKEEFLTWCKGVKLLKGFPASNEMVWQECRIRSGYASDDAYLALGNRQSGFPREQQAERGLVCHIYNAFLQYAEAHGQTVPALADLRGRISYVYKLIAADEAQDLSFAQLLFLYTLSGRAISFFLGDNQLLNDNLSKLSFLKEMFHSHGHDPENVVSLGLTYRCSEAVTVLANALTRIKYELTGGAADSLARMLKVADPTLGKGTASLFELKNTRERERFAELASSSRDVFIVTLPEYMAEAQETFRTGQVFTPAEVKGLGARVVILWRLLDCDMAREAARSVAPVESSDDLRAGHKAKAGVGDTRYESFGNALIVAATRAVDHVVMFEKIKHDMKSIRGRIAKALEATQSRGAELAVAESTAVDWEEQAFDLYSRGYREQAQGIFVRSLKGRLEDFEGFIDAHHRKVDEGADVAVVESMAGGAAATATAVDVGLRRFTDLGASPAGEPVGASPVTSSDAQVRCLIDALSHLDSRGKDELLADKGNLVILRHMREELFVSIPLTAWSAWVGKKKTPRPLLLDLVADAEHGPFLLQRLLLRGFSISPTTWDFIDKTDHPVFQGTSIAYWLLMTPEGQGIFTQLRRTIDISKIITRDFLITAPPRRPGFSPLAMLIAFEPGLKLLELFAKHLPKVFQSISIAEWSSLHPFIRSEKGGQLSLINSFQSNPNGLTIFLSILESITESCSSGKEAKRIAAHLTELKQCSIGDPYMAAINGDIETLRTAHGLGVDLSQCKNESGFTLAMLAAQHGQVGVIRGLHRLEVPFDDIKGVAAACCAIIHGKIDALLAFHECGVPFSSDDQEILAVDLFAAAQGSVPALIVLKERCGVDLNRDSGRGGAAYHAAKNKRLPALKEIFRCCPEKDPMGLLFLTVSWGSCEIAEFLISKMEDINCPCIMTDKQLIRYLSGSSEAGMLVSNLVSQGQDASALKVRAIDIADVYKQTKIIALLAEKMSKQERAFAASGRARDEAPRAGFASARAALPQDARDLTPLALSKAAPGLDGGSPPPRLQAAVALSQWGLLATPAAAGSASRTPECSPKDDALVKEVLGMGFAGVVLM